MGEVSSKIIQAPCAKFYVKGRVIEKMGESFLFKPNNPPTYNAVLTYLRRTPQTSGGSGIGIGGNISVTDVQSTSYTKTWSEEFKTEIGARELIDKIEKEDHCLRCGHISKCTKHIPHIMRGGVANRNAISLIAESNAAQPAGTRKFSTGAAPSIRKWLEKRAEYYPRAITAGMPPVENKNDDDKPVLMKNILYISLAALFLFAVIFVPPFVWIWLLIINCIIDIICGRR